MYCKISQVTFPVVYKQMWFLVVIGGFLWVSSASLIQQHLLLQWQLTAAPLNQLFLFSLNTNRFLDEIQICKENFFSNHYFGLASEVVNYCFYEVIIYHNIAHIIQIL